MRVLFISQKDIDLNVGGISSDLIKHLLKKGHNVVLCCADSKYSRTQVICNGGIEKVAVKVPNQYGVNIIKKGLIILSLETAIKRAIKKYLADERFDLILYATPPITLANVVKFCKRKYECKAYLMLKDIFPQNAVDLHMLSRHGLTGVIYRIFRAKEKRLYKYSDGIGCMSDANIKYLTSHNDNLGDKVIELFPNAISINNDAAPIRPIRKDILNKYGVTPDKLTFIYGGNLGKPQGLDFIAKAIKECCNIGEVYFIIIGKGSEKSKLFVELRGLPNVLTLDALPKEDYEKLCGQCDIGMVTLDKRFTIPNYPSRMLSYLANAMPIFACTDKNTDVREFVENQAKCGKWCWSGDIDAFKECVKWFVANRDKLEQLGRNGYAYMKANFNVADNVKKLEEFVCKNKEDKNV